MPKSKKNLNILVSAGPTQEPIDPVRFISNYSTGFLGYRIAEEAQKRGHRVVLVSGPTKLKPPKGVTLITVQRAAQLYQVLKAKFGWCDCLIMTAAVCDFRVKRPTKSKIKRGRKKGLTLRLIQSRDILQALTRRKGRRLVLGFALESEDLLRNAYAKLQKKKLDFIVATQIKSNSYPFGPQRINALIIDKKNKIQKIEGLTKAHLARILLDSIEKIML